MVASQPAKKTAFLTLQCTVVALFPHDIGHVKSMSCLVQQLYSPLAGVVFDVHVTCSSRGFGSRA